MNDELLGLLNLGLGVAILISIYVGFVRGDLQSGKNVTRIVTATVIETLEQLGIIPRKPE